MRLKKNVSAIITAMFSLSLAFGGLAVRRTAAAETGAPLFSMDEILRPVWEGTLAYQESALIVEEEDGSLAPVRMFYPMEEIVEVKSASLLKTYEEGKDYSLSEGKLVVNPEGAIPVLTYAAFHPESGEAGFEDRAGGYVLWKEGSWFHSRQIVVTYKHAEGYGEYIPEGKGRLLPGTREKLKGDTFNILVYGDSISTGANSSGHPSIHVSPEMPIYPELFAEGIRRLYGIENVNVYNASLGGTDSAWGLSNLRGGVLDKYENIDLAVLAFGMNDTTRDAEGYANNMQRMVKGLKSKYKDAEVLLVAPMLPNYAAYKFYGNQAYFYDALKIYETDGVAAVNVTGVHAGLLETKSYADMTGNNVNHANDYLARIYAQTLLKTLEVSDYGKEPVEEDSGSSSEEGGGSTDTTAPPAGESQTSPEENPGGCGSSLGVAGIGGCALLALFAAAVITKKNKTNQE